MASACRPHHSLITRILGAAGRRPGETTAPPAPEGDGGAGGTTGYLTAPEVRPDWICRWKMAYTMIIGRIAMVSAANSPDQSAS